jgi:hypothetical protein
VESYVSYCGRYEVRGESVFHHVEMSLFPNWVGTQQERYFQFAGDRLILSTPPFTNATGDIETARITWQKIDGTIS